MPKLNRFYYPHPPSTIIPIRSLFIQRTWGNGQLMIIAAIIPIAFWVNRSKRLFVKREFEEELFEYISSHINFYFPSVVPPLLEICIKKMTFLKEERKGKKKNHPSTIYSHNSLSILIKFKLSSSSRTHGSNFSKVHSQGPSPRSLTRGHSYVIVSGWKMWTLLLSTRREDAMISFSKGRIGSFYIRGFLKDLDVLNFAGVMGMTRGNEVLLPRGGIIPTESYIILRATWTPSARGWFKGEVMGLARVNRASAKEARSSRKHSSSAIVSNDPDGSISIGFVTRFNGIVTSWFQFGILFVHNVPGYDGCDFVFLFLLLSWKKLIGNVSLWVENSLDENVYYLFYINLDLVYYSFK